MFRFSSISRKTRRIVPYCGCFRRKPLLARKYSRDPTSPPDRVRVLRTAFEATMKDPALLAQARKQGLEIGPVSGEELQRVVQDMLSMPKPVIDRLNEILGPRR